MAIDPTDLFIVLLLAYMVFSVWTKLDARYLVAAALILLVVAAGVDAAGATGTANTLATFVFFLLAGGVVLLLVEHVREARRTPRGGRASPSDPSPAGGPAAPP